MQDKKLNAPIESLFERFVIVDSPANPFTAIGEKLINTRRMLL